MLLQIFLRFCLLGCVSHQLLIFPLKENKIWGPRIAEPLPKLLAMGINMPVGGSYSAFRLPFLAIISRICF